MLHNNEKKMFRHWICFDTFPFHSNRLSMDTEIRLNSRFYMKLATFRIFNLTYALLYENATIELIFGIQLNSIESK